MEKMEGKNLIDITCDVMSKIIEDVCGKEKKFLGLDFGRVSNRAINAVRTGEINLLTRGALEEKIKEFAEEELNKD